MPNKKWTVIVSFICLLLVAGAFLGGFKYGVVTGVKATASTSQAIKDFLATEESNPLIKKAMQVARATTLISDDRAIDELDQLLEGFSERQFGWKWETISLKWDKGGDNTTAIIRYHSENATEASLKKPCDCSQCIPRNSSISITTPWSHDLGDWDRLMDSLNWCEEDCDCSSGEIYLYFDPTRKEK